MDSTFSGSAVSRSVLDYARLALEKGTADQKKMVHALLVYGGYSQGYFNKDEDNPAYNLLAEFGYEIPTLDDINANTITQELTHSTNDIGISYFNQSAVLDSALYMRTRFKLGSGESIDNFTFTLIGPGNEVTELEAKKEGSTYYVDILDIAAAYWDYMYKITVTNKSTGESYDITCSVMAWVDRMLGASTNADQIMMGKAMYFYNQAANAFFKK
jgi:hypothetical protein